MSCWNLFLFSVGAEICKTIPEDLILNGGNETAGVKVYRELDRDTNRYVDEELKGNKESLFPLVEKQPKVIGR